MSSPLLSKELREIWWMGLAALVAAAFVAFDAMGIGIGHDWRIDWGQRRGRIPFLSGDFRLGIGMTAICLGAGLGLWQTMSESITGTWSYLLHRPIRRGQIIATKLFAGVGILIISIGLPFLVYFLWALSGVHAAPFEFWMMEDSLRLWAAGVVAYLAAFLTGIRTAHIYISRLWPVVPAGLIIAAQEEAWPTVGWCLVLAGIVLLLPSIFFAAENRDYA